MVLNKVNIDKVCNINDYQYPYNVIYLLEKSLKNTEIEITRKNFIKLIYDVLTDTQIQILELRYRDNFTYKEISERMGLSRERVRKIEIYIINKLQNVVSFSKYYSISYSEYIKVLSEKDELEKRLNFILTKTNIVLNEKSDNDTYSKDDVYISGIKLSTRSYNILSRHGIKTLRDISEIKERDFNNIKGIGPMVRDEIIETMHKYGYNMDWENQLC